VIVWIFLLEVTSIICHFERSLIYWSEIILLLELGTYDEQRVRRLEQNVWTKFELQRFD
ncbi:hypothetical protein Csa_006701, partial [Cucumis sativus]